jgi:hypothetical protein
VCSPDRPAPPTPAHFAARVDFLKDEVFEICGALALAESLLVRLGLVGEAAYLAAVFEVVEERLVVPGVTTMPSRPGPARRSARAS